MFINNKLKSVLVFLSVFSIIFQQIIAAPIIYGNEKVETVVSVYDGDTFKVDIEGYPAIIGKSISIRIFGIDCPEKRGSRGKMKEFALAAKEYTLKRLKEATEIILQDMRRGKYFRIVSKVIIDGRDLAQELIQAGLAKPYDGKGPKPKWTIEDALNFEAQLAN